MKAFQYATAHSTDSARELVADKGAYLAGGNDLLGLLKDYLVPAPNILVNIKSLPGLNKIERGEKYLDDWRARHRRTKSKTTRKFKRFSRPARRRVGNRLAANPQRRHRRRQSGATFALLVFPPSRHGLPQEGRRPLLRARTAKTATTVCSPATPASARSFPVSATTFRRARCHGHCVARRQRDAHEHGRALPSRLGKSARAQFAQQRRSDFARGNSDDAQPQRLSASRATSTRLTGRWSVARRRRKSWTEN